MLRVCPKKLGLAMMLNWIASWNHSCDQAGIHYELQEEPLPEYIQ